MPAFALPVTGQSVATSAVLLGWLILGAMLLRARLRMASAGPTRKRDLGSWLGLGLQGVGFALAFGRHGPRGSALLAQLPPGGQWLLALVAATLALASAAFAAAAIRELGKQWSLTARLLEGHELVTSGPFARVRHPIYSALLGLLLATGLAWSSWPMTLAALAVYVFGTHLRAGREERLLLAQFGERYRDYARRVPRLLPRLRAAPPIQP
jgi:protein-S-isoprenylcysteine O-methyltransferase Ste14